MTAQRSNCNLFVLFGVSVVHYILRVVPQECNTSLVEQRQGDG